MIRHILGFTFSLLAVACFSQDLIIKMNGDEIETKQTLLTETAVVYSAASDSTNKLQQMPLDSVFMIKFADGSKKVIEHQASVPKNTSPQTVEPSQQVVNTAPQKDTVTSAAVHQEEAPLIKFTANKRKYYFAGHYLTVEDIVIFMKETKEQEFMEEAERIEKHIRKRKINNWSQFSVIPSFFTGLIASAIAGNAGYMLIPVVHSSLLAMAANYHKNMETKLSVRGVKALNKYILDYPSFGHYQAKIRG